MTAKKKATGSKKTSDAPALPVKALVQMTDWMLDHAVVAADGDHDDLACVERVRAFLRASMVGRGAPPPPSEAEFLTTMALAIAALERRHGITGLGEAVAATLDAATAPVTTCCVHGHRAPRVAPHLYCVP